MFNHRFAISGTTFCLFSALAFTTANVCMRKLTALHCDPIWAVFGRETISGLLAAPYVFYRLARGWPTLPTGRILWNILLVSLLIQLTGNLGVQWALGIVGLAVTIPAEFGIMLVGSALLGRLWLGERVSLRSAAAIALVLAALILLGIGAEAAGSSKPASNAPETGPLLLVLAVVVAGTSGITFAIMNIAIRHSVMRSTLPSALAFLMPIIGTFTLGPICLYRLGLPELLNTPLEQVLWMVGAGILNLMGFMSIIHGLKRTTAVHANILNASQVALAAIVGMAIFHEPPNLMLLLGIGLTIAGILRFDHPIEGGSI